MILGTIDPAWALPANTVLLIALAIINNRLIKETRRVKETAREAKDELLNLANVTDDTDATGKPGGSP